MGSKWETVKLSDIGTVVGGATPSTKKQEYWNGDIPWVSPKDLTGYRYRYIKHGQRSITDKGLQKSSAQMLPAGTVLFSSRAPIGYVAIAENPICTNQGFKSVIPGDRIDALFLYYLLSYNKENIAGLGSGTTFKEISGTVMKNVSVIIPTDIDTQRKIAGILDSIDSKIELNQRTNDYLAELLDTEFNELMSRKSSDWASASLLDIANYKNGLAMQKFRPTGDDAGLPVLKIRELGQGYCGPDAERCRSDIDESVRIHDGDLIFSWSGTLLLDFWAGGDAGLNQHLFKVTSDKYPSWFYYSWTKHHMRRFISMAKDRATTMGHIKRSALQDSEVFIPRRDEMQVLTIRMQPLVDELINRRVESRKLAEYRDALLPNLMSGEVDVSRIELPMLPNNHLSAC